MGQILFNTVHWCTLMPRQWRFADAMKVTVSTEKDWYTVRIRLLKNWSNRIRIKFTSSDFKTY